jgi:tetratricopeptide (TPR) repeat protein
MRMKNQVKRCCGARVGIFTGEGCKLWLALALLIALVNLPARAQQSAALADRTTVRGTVLDERRGPVEHASVRVTENGSVIAETTTNAAGSFVFSALQPGNYRIHAEKSATRSREVAFDLPATGDRNSTGNRNTIDLVLENPATQPASPASASAMQFSDQPNFTIAGVTDWTAIGGHGSDFSLRTTESLARETLTLKPGEKSAAGTAGAAPSEQKLRDALAQSPESFQTNQQLGEFYLRAGKYQQAVALLEHASRINPADPHSAYDLALASEGVGDLEQARDRVNQFLQHHDNADLHRLAGELDEKLNDPLDAVRQFEDAAHQEPTEQNDFAWGSELLLHRAVWQAQEVFQKGVEAWPKSARMRTALGTALFAGARYNEAAQRLCEASDLDPTDPDPYLFMGKVEIAAPDPLPCILPALARFAQQQPGNANAQYLYAMAILKSQQKSPNAQAQSQAENRLRTAVTLDPACADAWLELGILASDRQQLEDSIQLYTRAIAANPKLGDAHYRLAVAYKRTGQTAKAAQEFQLHDQIVKEEKDAVERQREKIKQFLILQPQDASHPPAS